MSALLRIISCSGSFDLAAFPFPFPVKTITEGFFCHLSFSAHLSFHIFSAPASDPQHFGFSLAEELKR